MLFQRINRTDAEKVFVIHRNAESSDAWIKGAPVVLNSNGTRDGVDAVQLNTGAAAKAPLMIGVADAATVSTEYGLVQCYGLRTDAVLNQGGTASNGNGAIGDILIPWTASDAFSGKVAGVATDYSPWAILMQTVASSTAIATTTGSIFLRCM